MSKQHFPAPACAGPTVVDLSIVVRSADYVWRLFGTGTAFLLFGLGGALMSVTVFPVVNLVASSSSARIVTTRRIIHGTFRFFVGFLVLTRVIELEVHGAKFLRDRRGVLIIANHPSLLDVVLLMSLMPESQCVVKSKLWRSPFLGGVVRAAGYIRNDGEPEKLVNDCVLALRDGQNLVIFPEGSRTAPGNRPEFRRGFAHVALRAEADIIPITIYCTPTTLTKGEPWFAIPTRRVLFQVFIRRQLHVRDYAELETPAIAARRLSRDVEQIYANELEYERSGI